MNRQSRKPRNAGAVHSAYSARAHAYIDLLGDSGASARDQSALGLPSSWAEISATRTPSRSTKNS